MSSLRTAAILFTLLFTLTGLAYPAAVLLVAGTAFPFPAHGSLVTAPDGQVTGSLLIGQDSTLPWYFQGRPSATTGKPSNGASSGGSNLGPTSPALLRDVELRMQALRDRGIKGPVPSDLVMASGSGLDPHLSLEAALLQVPVVAEARNIPEDQLKERVLSLAVYPAIPFSGPYVNVAALNRELDRWQGGDGNGSS
ncbi:MAG: potassium-transporting ATPase subunit C [Methanomicrobiales archaeon]|nr:potassium-transporting ATPase subunit C [Methanomicrobiales archaeon]